MIFNFVTTVLMIYNFGTTVLMIYDFGTTELGFKRFWNDRIEVFLKIIVTLTQP